LYPAACAVLCAAMLALGGCMQATQAIVMRHYDLGAMSAGSGENQATPRRAKILQVARISVPEWLAGTDMYYRLDYRDDRRLAAYAHSDWIAPPAALLETIVRRALAADGGWRAVTGPRDPANADATLHLRLDDFSQAFPQPEHSFGVIDVTATLIDNHTGRVVAQRHFHVKAAAPTPDAQGGVEALADASRRLAAQLQDWLQTAAKTSG
jgi:cholesterol transport system auxiliary component